MVGIVLVSHSAILAEGVAELAREMGGGEVPLEAAGGLDLPDRPLGTDAMLVLGAIERAWSGDGVLVLMDLGSAVLSAEMALDMLDPERRQSVLLCEAPLVEGAVAAAATARTGAGLEEVAREARGGLAPKAAHLGAAAPEGEAPPVPVPVPGVPALAVTLPVTNPLGLHARPAALLVRTAASFDAEVGVTNLTTGRGPAPARSLNAVATLGVRQGHEVLVSARGPQAREALAALEELARRGWGDAAVPAPPAPPPPAPAPLPGAGLRGLPASPGIASGPARYFRPAEVAIPDHAAEDPDREWAALREAIEAVRAEIGATRDSIAARSGDYEAAIFDAHLLILEDPELLETARRAVAGEGRNAAAALAAAASGVAAAYRALDDPYQRARAADVEAVARQVVARLAGVAGGAAGPSQPGILIAPDLTPAETAGLDPTLVRGIATAAGAPTSHSAILARALGIPAVVGVGEALLAVSEGTPVVLDGSAGALLVDPAPEVLAEYETRRRAGDDAEREARAAAHAPALTRDGVRIEVAANAGSVEDAAAALAAGADGVGLLRTEFLFLGRAAPPSEQEQEAILRKVAEALEGRPLVVRTLDAGADKPLPYLNQAPETNPFLGVRGVRLTLARPDVLRAQARALLRVAAGHPVSVMFPMVATVDEYRAARALWEEVRKEMGAPPVPVGIMVEVPAAALGAELFAGEVDFFSIGTNDLTQYVMAAERGNAGVASLADPLHPAVLHLVRRVAEAAAVRGRWVGVCGEAASDPEAVPVLAGLGVTELSVAPPAVPRVKAVVRALDLYDARRLAESALGMASAQEVRAAAAGLLR